MRDDRGRGNGAPRASNGRSLQAGPLHDWPARSPRAPVVVGVLAGEGVGPEVLGVALDVLRLVGEALDVAVDVRHGGLIGGPALAATGQSLPADVSAFCEEVFADGGALLCGPGGARFVYDLRRRFDLFTKLTPIQPSPALRGLGPLRPGAVDRVSMVVVRENTGGVYQGEWAYAASPGERATHSFAYTRAQTERILRVGFRLARARRDRVAVVTKPGGVPSVSALWIDTCAALEKEYGLAALHLEVDNAAYQLIARARDFDVVIAPNLFGDILGDAASLLLGSRGLSYSGNFGVEGRAVYQTAHGAAHDIAGKDVANPLGQVFALAMMLGESFGRHDVSNAIFAAADDVLAAGVRTADIATDARHNVGTKAMGRELVDALANHLDPLTTAR